MFQCKLSRKHVRGGGILLLLRICPFEVCFDDDRASCPAMSHGEYSVSYGFRAAAGTYYRTFIPQIVDRMNALSSDYTFTGTPPRKLTPCANVEDRDILAMSNICPFQINALGYSPFCDIFTEKEWRDFNYARDLATYYGSGYTSPPKH